MSFAFFEAINPRLSDYLYIVLFPIGSFTFIIGLLILIGYYIHHIICKISYQRNILNKVSFGKPDIFKMMIITFTGLFLIPLLIIWLSLICKENRNYIGAILDKFRDILKKENELTRRTRIYTQFKFIFIYLQNLFNNLIFFIPLPAGFLVGYILGYLIGYWIFIGSIIGILITSFDKSNFIINILNFKFRKQIEKNIIYVITIAIPILSGSVFVSSNFIKTHPPAPNEPTYSGLTQLKIMTYNIRLGVAIEPNPANNWANRKDDLVAYIDTFDLDIIGFQEAYIFQIDYALSNLHSRNYRYTGFGRGDGVHGDEHSCILFDYDRFRYIDGDSFWLSNTPIKPSKFFNDYSNNRICTWARFEVRITGEQFCVFCIHNGFGQENQIKSSRLLNQKITEHSGGLPTFLMGDFNFVANTPQYNSLNNTEDSNAKTLYDSFSLFYDWNPPIIGTTNQFNFYSTSTNRIDFIFISENIDVNNCWIPKDSYGSDNLVYSDHYPVILDCEF